MSIPELQKESTTNDYQKTQFVWDLTFIILQIEIRMSSFLMNNSVNTTNYLDPKFPPPLEEYGAPPGATGIHCYGDYYGSQGIPQAGALPPHPQHFPPHHPHNHHQMYYHQQPHHHMNQPPPPQPIIYPNTADPSRPHVESPNAASFNPQSYPVLHQHPMQQQQVPSVAQYYPPIDDPSTLSSPSLNGLSNFMTQQLHITHSGQRSKTPSPPRGLSHGPTSYLGKYESGECSGPPNNNNDCDLSVTNNGGMGMSPPTPRMTHMNPDSVEMTLSPGEMDDDESSNDIPSDCSENQDGERKIFPWMKKIHVAGVGEWKICPIIVFKTLSLVLSL